MGFKKQFFQKRKKILNVIFGAIFGHLAPENLATSTPFGLNSCYSNLLPPKKFMTSANPIPELQASWTTVAKHGFTPHIRGKFENQWLFLRCFQKKVMCFANCHF